MARCEKCIYKSHYRDMGWSADICTRGEYDLATAIDMCKSSESCQWHITAKQLKALQESKLKSEVAREIFEELEKWLGIDGDIRLITDKKLAELKEKYTEGGAE